MTTEEKHREELKEKPYEIGPEDWTPIGERVIVKMFLPTHGRRIATPAEAPSLATQAVVGEVIAHGEDCKVIKKGMLVRVFPQAGLNLGGEWSAQHRAFHESELVAYI